MRHALAQTETPPGTWLDFSAALFRPAAPEHATLLSTTAMAAGLLLLALVVVRLIARPLRDLAAAADRIGLAGDRAPAPPLAEDEGPREVRHAAAAFNRVGARLDRLVADRTQALAAVSHDLRTPIARLRLRAGFLDDAEAQRAVDADLDEMEAMVDSTLAYLRGEAGHEGEPERSADLAAMLATLCDDAADAGRGPARYEGPGHVPLGSRPVALKRAFANLVDNALKYGGSARVPLSASGGSVVVRVGDDGPGVPEESLEAVLEPFRRLEDSRNRGTGGSGLGLTIARRAVEAHGGALTLRNREGGGLEALVVLPRPPPPPPPSPAPAAVAAAAAAPARAPGHALS